MASFVRELLEEMVRRRASDLHLTVNVPPVLRVDGRLMHLEGYGPLEARDTLEAARELTRCSGEEIPRDLDFSVGYSGLGRFRVNVFYQRGSVCLALRQIPAEVPRLEELGLPEVLAELTRLTSGLILVTGPTGSGKSTTLAAMIDEINREQRVHIITLEDPIEFLHSHKQSIVNQREVGRDTDSFARGLRAALRQDPDVILVGEMRDLETIATAITAAETGHLVLATLHTPDATRAVDRVIDVFPADQQEQIRVQLSATLQAVIAQQLVPRARGDGRVAACEVLVATPAVRALIRERKTHQLYSAMQTGARFGMTTMEQSLRRLLEEGFISREEYRRRTGDLGINL